MRLLARLLPLLALCAAPAAAQTSYRGPIIDVHLHGYAGTTGAVSMRGFRFLPPAYAKETSPATGEEHMRQTLRMMERHNVVLGLVSAGAGTDQLELARAWRAAGGERIRMGYAQQDPLVDVKALAPAALEPAFRSGRFAALSELAPQYAGLSASDPRFADYFALAERLDVPVGIHTGTAPPRQANRRAPAFRTHFGDPRLIEEVLIRHPKLRVWLMHAGWPYLAETKIVLQQYPEVYADLGAISWLLPRVEFHNYLKALVDAGFGDRLMFGSDQMLWPQAIPLAIDGVASAQFLGAEQKADIFYNNAARFFRLAADVKGVRQ